MVVTSSGKRDLLTIPEGSIITVCGPPCEKTSLLPIQWSNTAMEMYALDLERRAESVPEASN